MIKIGFVDYYLDEWHATNYPGMLARASEELGIPCEIVGAYAALDIPPHSGLRSTDEWCRELGIKKYATIASLAEACDSFLIFSPDNPEQHYPLAKAILPYGKPTFIDKTFAASYEDAKRIIELAKAHGTPMYSTSSLRYAAEIEGTRGSRVAAIEGNYVHMKDYLVHTGEMVVTVLGTGISTVTCRTEGETYYFAVDYADGRAATVKMAPDLPFKVNDCVVTSDFFGAQIENILLFYSDKEPKVSYEEMLEVATFIDLATAAIKENEEK